MTGAIADEIERRTHVGVDLSDFGSWMTSEQKRIYLLCRRMLGDPEEADSATQDAFLKAYKALQKASHEPGELDHPDKWITRIAVNTCLDRLRSKAWKFWQKRPPVEDERVILEMAPGLGPNAERQLFAKQIQQRLETALAKLSNRQKAVFSLRHYDAMPLEEIADVLKLDTGTVKAHLFRAIGKLREELQDLYTAGAGAEVRSERRKR